MPFSFTMSNLIKVCNVCKSHTVIYCDNKFLYGESRGEWSKIYYCITCKSYVGCHPNTNLPLGTLANQTTRRYRRKAHLHFDKIWKDNLLTREESYKWMADVLELSLENAHIGLLSRENLVLLIEKSIEFHSQKDILLRRREKDNAKRIKRASRERKASDVGRQNKRY